MIPVPRGFFRPFRISLPLSSLPSSDPLIRHLSSSADKAPRIPTFQRLHALRCFLQKRGPHGSLLSTDPESALVFPRLFQLFPNPPTLAISLSVFLSYTRPFSSSSFFNSLFRSLSRRFPANSYVPFDTGRFSYLVCTPTLDVDYFATGVSVPGLFPRFDLRILFDFIFTRAPQLRCTLLFFPLEPLFTIGSVIFACNFPSIVAPAISPPLRPSEATSNARCTPFFPRFLHPSSFTCVLSSPVSRYILLHPLIFFFHPTLCLHLRSIPSNFPAFSLRFHSRN